MMICSKPRNVNDCFHVTDGSLYMATPIDPVFILLPIFDEARMKVAHSMLPASSRIQYCFPSGFSFLEMLIVDL